MKDAPEAYFARNTRTCSFLSPGFIVPGHFGPSSSAASCMQRLVSNIFIKQACAKLLDKKRPVSVFLLHSAGPCLNLHQIRIVVVSEPAMPMVLDGKRC